VEQKNKRKELFQSLYKVQKEEFDLYVTNSRYDDVVLRNLTKRISYKYNAQTANRYNITSQIVGLLKETVPFGIVKIDIKKFYENINKDQILEGVQCNPLISLDDKSVLQKLFETDLLRTQKGLPRGLSISAVLSEIYLQEFDRKVRQLEGVYFYARYVDDIIVFTYENPAEVRSNIIPLLPTGLSLNEEKSKKCFYVACRCQGADKGDLQERQSGCRCSNISENDFSYLGYRFVFPAVPASKVNLSVQIARSKIDRIKTKIVLSFLAYRKDSNFRLLVKRIKLLTGNYSLYTELSAGKTLCAGIYYNYPLLSTYCDLDELNSFLRSWIWISRKKSKCNLSRAQKIELMKFNFRSGYIYRRHERFSKDELKIIQGCWKDVF
jgi:hypothetical protein